MRQRAAALGQAIRSEHGRDRRHRVHRGTDRGYETGADQNGMSSSMPAGSKAGLLAAGRRPLRARRRRGTGEADAVAAAFAAPVEHGEVRVEALEHDLGRVLVGAGLVLPFAGLQLRPRDRPCCPCCRYCSATLARPSEKITTRCHSVFSLRSPVFLSRQFSDVATDRLTTLLPLGSVRTSGSAPRLPTRMTLFTLPAMAQSFRSYAASLERAARILADRPVGCAPNLGCTQRCMFLLCSHWSGCVKRGPLSLPSVMK